MTLAIFGHFLPFHPPKNLKNQNFEKIIIKKTKKNLEILSFYTCVQMTIIRCMVPEIWSVMDRISPFGATFCPFTPITTPKIRLKKMKKISGDIIILHMHNKYHDHMIYDS